MGWLGIASVKKWRSCSAALLAYANDVLDTAVRSVQVQKENFWSVSENQPFSKHVILGGLMSGGLKSGGRLSGGRLSYDPLDHPPPRNANNVEHYTLVTLFSRKIWHPPPPSALRNTWMAPLRLNRVVYRKHGIHEPACGSD